MPPVSVFWRKMFSSLLYNCAEEWMKTGHHEGINVVSKLPFAASLSPFLSSGHRRSGHPGGAPQREVPSAAFVALLAQGWVWCDSPSRWKWWQKCNDKLGISYWENSGLGSTHSSFCGDCYVLGFNFIKSNFEQYGY